MTELLLAITFVLALIGLPSVGIILTHLYYYRTNSFPWQLQKQLLQDEVSRLSNEGREAREELQKIHNKLVEAISPETK